MPSYSTWSWKVWQMINLQYIFKRNRLHRKEDQGTWYSFRTMFWRNIRKKKQLLPTLVGIYESKVNISICHDIDLNDFIHQKFTFTSTTTPTELSSVTTPSNWPLQIFISQALCCLRLHFSKNRPNPPFFSDRLWTLRSRPIWKPPDSNTQLDELQIHFS